MRDTHNWEVFDEEEGNFRFAVCIYCGAYLSQDLGSNKKSITLDGKAISDQCSDAPPDDDAEVQS